MAYPLREYQPSRDALKILRCLKHGASLTPETISRRTRISLMMVEAQVAGLEASELITQSRGSRKCQITDSGKELLKRIIAG